MFNFGMMAGKSSVIPPPTPLPTLTGFSQSRAGGQYILTFTGLNSGCRIYCELADNTRGRWLIPASIEFSSGGSPNPDPGYALGGVDNVNFSTASLVNIGDSMTVKAYQYNPATGGVSPVLTSNYTAT